MFSAVEKVVPHSPGVLDFAFVLVNSVVNLPDKWGELSFLRGGGGVGGVGVFKLQKNCNQSCVSKIFWGRCDLHQATKKTPTKFSYPKKLQIKKVRTQKIFGSSTSLEIRSTLSGAVAIACPKDTL